MARTLVIVAILALLVSSPAWAQPGMPGERTGLLVQEGGATADQEVNVFDFDTGDFDLTCSGGACSIALGPDVVLTSGRAGGQAIDGGTLATQTLTLDPNAASTAGRVTLTETGSGFSQFIVSYTGVTTWPNNQTTSAFQLNSNFTSSGGNSIPRYDFWTGTITYTATGPGGHAPVMAEYAPTINLDYTGTWFGGVGFAAVQNLVVQNGRTITMSGAEGDFIDAPTFAKVSGGTGTVDAAATHRGFQSLLTLGTSSANTGITLNTREGFLAEDVGLQNGGALTNNIGFRVEPMTSGSTLISGFQSEIASGSGRWNFRASGDANNGFAGAVRIGDTTAPTTADGLEVVGMIKPLMTVATNPGNPFSAIEFAPTYTHNSGLNVSQVIRIAPTVTIDGGTVYGETAVLSTGTYTMQTNLPAVTSSLITFQSATTSNLNLAGAAAKWNPLTFQDNSIVIAGNVAAGTMAAARAFVASPTLKASGASGSMTVTRYSGFYSSPNVTTDTAGGASTVTTLAHYDVVDVSKGSGAGTETITTQVGLDVPQLANATTNIGIRNASPTVFMPSTAQAIAAVGNTILCNATVVQVTVSAGGIGPLTSAPQIANGQDGQLCIIINADTADALTLESTFATGGIRLGAADLVLGPGDSIALVYNSTLADWIRVASADN